LRSVLIIFSSATTFSFSLYTIFSSLNFSGDISSLYLTTTDHNPLPPTYATQPWVIAAAKASQSTTKLSPPITTTNHHRTTHHHRFRLLNLSPASVMLLQEDKLRQLLSPQVRSIVLFRQVWCRLRRRRLREGNSGGHFLHRLRRSR